MLLAEMLAEMARAGVFLIESHSLEVRPREPRYCVLVEQNVNEYFFKRYQDTPKIDTYIKRVKVSKKRWQIVRTNEDFAWKDPKAAELLKVSLKSYLFDRTEQDFKQRVYWFSRTIEARYFPIGYKSWYRGDERQAMITNGIRAPVGYSRHGGSKAGGVCRAVDLSVTGSRSMQLIRGAELLALIKRIGPRFGLTNPYKNDPFHVEPLHTHNDQVVVATVKPKHKKKRSKTRLAKVRSTQHAGITPTTYE